MDEKTVRGEGQFTGLRHTWFLEASRARQMSGGPDQQLLSSPLPRRYSHLQGLECGVPPESYQ